MQPLVRSPIFISTLHQHPFAERRVGPGYRSNPRLPFNPLILRRPLCTPFGWTLIWR